MHLDRRGELAVYRFDTLRDGGLDAFVSTRLGGVSAPPYASLNLGLGVGDEASAVIENRRRLLCAYGLSPARSVWCRQVHSDRVTVVGTDDAGRGSVDAATIVPDADALVTDVPGLALCVTVADCVPVVIHDPVRAVVGLAHAGWGGTVARIASRTVAVMEARFGSDPTDLVAAIGPSIGPESYEVGEDVIDRARSAFGEQAEQVLRPTDDGKALFDLWAANRLDLEQAGVPTDRIEVAGVSTAASLDLLFSHRVEGGPTGRFIAAASLTQAG